MNNREEQRSFEPSTVRGFVSPLHRADSRRMRRNVFLPCCSLVWNFKAENARLFDGQQHWWIEFRQVRTSRYTPLGRLQEKSGRSACARLMALLICGVRCHHQHEGTREP